MIQYFLNITSDTAFHASCRFSQAKRFNTAFDVVGWAFCKHSQIFPYLLFCHLFLLRMKQYKFSRQMHLKNKPQVNVRSFGALALGFHELSLSLPFLSLTPHVSRAKLSRKFKSHLGAYNHAEFSIYPLKIMNDHHHRRRRKCSAVSARNQRQVVKSCRQI